jgi:predicted nucleic-acid-binding protein
MISIDTNVIVRLLVIDDVSQSERAKAIFESNYQVFIALSVVLETEWVLRVRYDFEKRALIDGLRRLLRLPKVVAEDGPRVLQALEWADAGMDFADALHLAGSLHCASFASFDRKLAKVSERIGAGLVREP